MNFMREKTKSNKLQNQNSMASSSWLNRLKLDKLFLGKQISDEKIGFSLNLSHASSLFKTKPDSQSKATIKSMALAIGLAMLSCSALYQAPAKTNVKTGTQAKIQTKSQTQSLPGVFIADIDGRWQIPNQGEDGKLLGGVVCEGGYIGSPLIPQDDSLIKRFLNECESGQRIGTGRLPIVDSPANHDENSSGYQAYKASVGGQTYYLCRGFLNSTDWCSFEAEKKAAQMLSEIDRPAVSPQVAYQGNVGSNLISQSVLAPYVSSQFGSPLSSQPQKIELTPLGGSAGESSALPKTLPSDVAQEISEALGEKAPGMSIPNLAGAKLIPVSPSSSNPSSSGLGLLGSLGSLNSANLQSSNQVTLGGNTASSNSTDSSANSPRAIQVTKEEIQALQSGQITLEQLAQNRPTVSLNGQNGLPNSMGQNAINNSNGSGLPSKAIGITEQDLQLLRSGQVALEQLVANRPVVDLMNNQTNQSMGQNNGQNMSQNLGMNDPRLAYSSQASSLNLPGDNYAEPMPRPRGTSEGKASNPDDMVEMIGATREDLEALKAGKVSLKDLVEIRPLMAIKQKNLPKLPSYAKAISPKVTPILAGLYTPINNPVLQEAQSEVDRLYAYCAQYSPYAYNQAAAYAANYYGAYNPGAFNFGAPALSGNYLGDYSTDYSNMAYQDMASQNTGYQDSYMPQTPHSVWW